MLRLASRSSPRGLTTTQWCRAASTTVPTPGPSTSSESSNPPPDKKDLLEQLENLANAKRKLPGKSTPKSTQFIAKESRPKVTFRSLGLKHDPAELPYKRVLDPNDSTITEEMYASMLVHGRSVQEPYFHPRTHCIPVANLHFRSHHVRLLNLFTHFAVHAASSLGIPASKVVCLPTKRRLWTALRSPFAHKKSQENFERKTHKRAIKAWDADPEVVQRWITYLRTNAMPGVGLKVTTWERLPLSVAASHMAQADGLNTAQNVSIDAPKRIKALGRKIVAEEALGTKA